MANVLVVGGTGGIGEACVRALLGRSDYARVVVSSREPAKLAALRERVRAPEDRLVTVVGSVAGAREAERLRVSAVAHGELGAVIASLGGWWQGGSLLGVDDASWHETLDELLTTHFVCARTFVPVLAASKGAYLALGGGAALTPVPNSALVSIAAAAQEMLVRALVAERGPARGPTIVELLVDAPVKTRGRHHGPRLANEIAADEVAGVVCSLLRDGSTGAWPAIERRDPIVVMRPAASTVPDAADYGGPA